MGSIDEAQQHVFFVRSFERLSRRRRDVRTAWTRRGRSFVRSFVRSFALARSLPLTHHILLSLLISSHLISSHRISSYRFVSHLDIHLFHNRSLLHSFYVICSSIFIDQILLINIRITQNLSSCQLLN